MTTPFNLTAQVTFQAQGLNAFVRDVRNRIQQVGISTPVQLKVNRGSFQAVNAETAKVVSNINKIGTAAKRNTAAVNTFGAGVLQRFRTFAQFTIVSRILIGITSTLSSATSEALKFQKSLIQIGQVTGASASQLGALSKEITRLSISLGVSSTELVGISKVLSQAGLSAKETEIALAALAKSTLAPTFKNIDNTAEGLIATFGQFNKTAKDSEAVLGSINAVAAKFAISADDIVKGIQRAGGAFAAAGGTFEELIGLLAAVRSSTRESAQAIATGLRTITTRLQRLSNTSALQNLNIQLRDTQGNFVGVFEAVERLNRGFANLDTRSAEFSALSEQLAGLRQISRFIPLITKIDVARRARDIAIGGTDSLNRDAIKAQDALLNKLTKVREEFLKLFRDLVSSDAFEKTIDAILTLTQAFTGLVKAVGPLLPLLAGIGAARLGLGAVGFVGGRALTAVGVAGFAASGGGFGGIGAGSLNRASGLGSIQERRQIAASRRASRGAVGGSLFAAGVGVPLVGSLLAEQLRPDLESQRQQLLTNQERRRQVIRRGGTAQAVETGALGAGIGILGGSLALAGAGAAAGASVGLLPGALIGAAVGGLIGAFKGFQDGIEETAKAIRELNIDSASTQFVNALSQLSKGLISSSEALFSANKFAETLRSGSFDIDKAIFEQSQKNFPKLEGPALAFLPGQDPTEFRELVEKRLSARASLFEERRTEINQLSDLARLRADELLSNLPSAARFSTVGGIPDAPQNEPADRIREQFLLEFRNIIKVISEANNQSVDRVREQFRDIIEEQQVSRRGQVNLSSLIATIQNVNLQFKTLGDTIDSSIRSINRISLTQILGNFGAVGNANISVDSLFGDLGSQTSTRNFLRDANKLIDIFNQPEIIGQRIPSREPIFARNRDRAQFEPDFPGVSIDLFEQILQRATAFKDIQADLPTILSDAVARGLDAESASGFVERQLIRRLGVSNFRRERPGEIVPDEIDLPQAQQKILNSVIQLLGAVPVKDFFDKAQKPDEFTAELLKGFGGSVTLLETLGKRTAEVLSDFQSNLAKVSEQISQIGVIFDRLQVGELNVQRLQAELRGAGLSRRVLNRPVISRLNSLTPRLGFNPESREISQRLRELRTEIVDTNRAIVSSRGGNQPADIARLTALEGEARDLITALKELTDVTRNSAGIQERLSRLQERANVFGDIGESIVFGDRQERQTIARSIRDTLLSVGRGSFDSLSSERRTGVRDLLQQFGTRQIAGQRADLILQQLQSGFLQRREGFSRETAEVFARAIGDEGDTLQRDLIEVQKVANEAQRGLIDINRDLTSVIKDSLVTNIVTLISTIRQDFTERERASIERQIDQQQSRQAELDNLKEVRRQGIDEITFAPRQGDRQRIRERLDNPLITAQNRLELEQKLLDLVSAPRRASTLTEGQLKQVTGFLQLDEQIRKLIDLEGKLTAVGGGGVFGQTLDIAGRTKVGAVNIADLLLKLGEAQKTDGLSPREVRDIVNSTLTTDISLLGAARISNEKFTVGLFRELIRALPNILPANRDLLLASGIGQIRPETRGARTFEGSTDGPTALFVNSLQAAFAEIQSQLRQEQKTTDIGEFSGIISRGRSEDATFQQRLTLRFLEDVVRFVNSNTSETGIDRINNLQKVLGSLPANLEVTTTEFKNLSDSIDILRRRLTIINQIISEQLKEVSPRINRVQTSSVIEQAGGGRVSGVGNTDSVRALLTPGEFVVRKQVAEKPGNREFLEDLNAGRVQAFQDGGPVRAFGQRQAGAFRRSPADVLAEQQQLSQKSRDLRVIDDNLSSLGITPVRRDVEPAQFREAKATLVQKISDAPFLTQSLLKEIRGFVPLRARSDALNLEMSINRGRPGYRSINELPNFGAEFHDSPVGRRAANRAFFKIRDAATIIRDDGFPADVTLTELSRFPFRLGKDRADYFEDGGYADFGDSSADSQKIEALVSHRRPERVVPIRDFDDLKRRIKNGIPIEEMRFGPNFFRERDLGRFTEEQINSVALQSLIKKLTGRFSRPGFEPIPFDLDSNPQRRNQVFEGIGDNLLTPSKMSDKNLNFANRFINEAATHGNLISPNTSRLDIISGITAEHQKRSDTRKLLERRSRTERAIDFPGGLLSGVGFKDLGNVNIEQDRLEEIRKDKVFQEFRATNIDNVRGRLLSLVPVSTGLLNPNEQFVTNILGKSGTSISAMTDADLQFATEHMRQFIDSIVIPHSAAVAQDVKDFNVPPEDQAEKDRIRKAIRDRFSVEFKRRRQERRGRLQGRQAGFRGGQSKAGAPRLLPGRKAPTFKPSETVFPGLAEELETQLVPDFFLPDELKTRTPFKPDFKILKETQEQRPSVPQGALSDPNLTPTQITDIILEIERRNTAKNVVDPRTQKEVKPSNIANPKLLNNRNFDFINQHQEQLNKLLRKRGFDGKDIDGSIRQNYLKRNIRRIQEEEQRGKQASILPDTQIRTGFRGPNNQPPLDIRGGALSIPKNYDKATSKLSVLEIEKVFRGIRQDNQGKFIKSKFFLADKRTTETRIAQLNNLANPKNLTPEQFKFASQNLDTLGPILRQQGFSDRLVKGVIKDRYDARIQRIIQGQDIPLDRGLLDIPDNVNQDIPIVDIINTLRGIEAANVAPFVDTGFGKDEQPNNLANPQFLTTKQFKFALRHRETTFSYLNKIRKFSTKSIKDRVSKDYDKVAIRLFQPKSLVPKLEPGKGDLPSATTLPSQLSEIFTSPTFSESIKNIVTPQGIIPAKQDDPGLVVGRRTAQKKGFPFAGGLIKHGLRQGLPKDLNLRQINILRRNFSPAQIRAERLRIRSARGAIASGRMTIEQARLEKFGGLAPGGLPVIKPQATLIERAKARGKRPRRVTPQEIERRKSVKRFLARQKERQVAADGGLKAQGRLRDDQIFNEQELQQHIDIDNIPDAATRKKARDAFNQIRLDKTKGLIDREKERVRQAAEATRRKIKEIKAREAGRPKADIGAALRREEDANRAGAARTDEILDLIPPDRRKAIAKLRAEVEERDRKKAEARAIIAEERREKRFGKNPNRRRFDDFRDFAFRGGFGRRAPQQGVSGGRTPIQGATGLRSPDEARARERSEAEVRRIEKAKTQAIRREFNEKLLQDIIDKDKAKRQAILVGGRRAQGFLHGGDVNSNRIDTVNAQLRPGEFVLSRQGLSNIGGRAAGNAANQSGNVADQRQTQTSPALQLNSEAMATLAAAFSKFMNSGERLARAMEAFPSNVTGQFEHSVHVNITGAEALAQMQNELGELVVNKAREQINKMLGNLFPDVGSAEA